MSSIEQHRSAKSEHDPCLEHGPGEGFFHGSPRREAAAFLLSPKQLEGRCASCHGAGKAAPKTEFAPEGRLMLEGIHDARALLKEANSFIRRISNKERRAQVEAAAQQAAVPLVQATNAGHAFVFDGLQERLTVARQRIAELFERLANPNERR